MNRREFNAQFGMAGVAMLLPQQGMCHSLSRTAGADHLLRILPTNVELARNIRVKTSAYDGRVPGPVLRVKKGRTITVDVQNGLDVDELVHWHGLGSDPVNDGTMEEGSPMILPGSTLRYTITPQPSGTRWYHTHASAGTDLRRSTYSGQFGFLIVEDGSDQGDYDQEVLLAVHHWEPALMQMEGHPCEVHYNYVCFNDKLFSVAEPIKVRQGQRVLFRFLNASATENVTLALPGHTFRVIALDGNPVPRPAEVETIFVAVAERIDAIVEMNHPGVWALASTDDSERSRGLGITIEYAGSAGPAIWKEPNNRSWDYTVFGANQPPDIAEDIFPMVFQRFANADGLTDVWTINGQSSPKIAALSVCPGRRYRLAFFDASGCSHPLHLHRHSFEIVSIDGKPTGGVVKDVVSLRSYGSMEVDFVADNPGPTLFHCHQQLHMDGGFMQLIRYKL